MATYSLAGSGMQALSSGTGALRVTVTSVPAIAGNGRANPTNLYDVGLLRQGDGTDWWRAESIDAVHMLLPLLATTTEIGYALLNGATIDVTEVIGASPFYPPSSAPSGAPVLLQETTVAGADVASVVFAAIANTYNDLLLRATVRCAIASVYDELLFRLNSDSGANYIRTLDDTGGSITDTSTSGRMGYASGSTATAGQAGTIETLFADYAKTTWHKTVVTRGETGASLYRSNRTVTSWLSTAAVTRLDVFAAGGDIKVGSHFRLYGLT